MHKTPGVKMLLFFTPLACFFGLTFHFKNWSTNEIGSFAHVHGAAEVTVKHDLMALKHKMVLQEHTLLPNNKERKYADE